MKQCLLILIACVAMTSYSHAQTESGTILLGGDATFQAFDGGSSFSASPRVGIFVLDDVVLGAGFSLYTTKGTSQWALGPFIRLYLFGNEKGKMIVQSGFNVGGAKNTDTDFGFDIGAGYAFFLNESIAVELLGNYIKTGNSKGIFTMGAGFQIHYRR